MSLGTDGQGGDIPRYIGYIGGERLVVSYAATGPYTGNVTFHDQAGGTIIAIDSRCSGSGTSTVVCPASNAQAPLVSVSGGLGDDVLDVRGFPATYSSRVNGDDGNDTILGGGAGSSLYGGAGADLIRGTDGHDVIDGGQGADRLFGAGGDDRLVHGDVGTFRQALDRLDCGPGADIGYWRTPDVAVSCETHY